MTDKQEIDRLIAELEALLQRGLSLIEKAGENNE
jgi:hypothetical protein